MNLVEESKRRIPINSSLGQNLMEKISQHSSDPARVAMCKREKHSYAQGERHPFLPKFLIVNELSSSRHIMEVELALLL